MIDNACGYSVGYEEYPYLYWPIPIEDYLQTSVCVKQCPSSKEELIECSPNAFVKACKNTADIDILLKTQDKSALGIIVEDLFLVYKTRMGKQTPG